MSKLAKYDKNMVSSNVESDTMNYYDPLKNDVFIIEGLPWVKENANYFRLPEKYIHNVSEAVEWLSKMPSGGQIRFKTNSTKISLRIKNFGDYQMCHMTACGQQGADIYYKNNKTYKFFSVTKFEEPSDNFESVIFYQDDKKYHEFIINLPLYEGIENILIGIDKDATILKATPHKNKGKIVVYGTSITQGGCASRPGMAFTNILSRKLDIEFVNLGFSGSGMGEPIIGDILSDINDARMFILDYEANGGCTSSLQDNMNTIIDKIRVKHPLIPIIVKTKSPQATEIFTKKDINHRQELYLFQKELVNKRQELGDKNIYFVDGRKDFGNKDIDEMTVDGLHPTDLGFYMMAKYLYPVIRKILKNENN